ncbi:embryo-specific protein ATS3A-like isoform X2 [Malania oleifera]|uniref:embryo-specific protein ATS3A-like isoform X2 n=1 Tax=Malania oleifera TaxID=397392 RepID=UPI0025AE5A85|nr:embryo-specific protein ATS3A-like isoform X2 [Malania oleifera]
MMAICNYTITIETTCAAGAETSNHVSLRFGDAKSNDVVVHHLNSKRVTQVDPFFPAELDGAPVKPFRACSVDEFQVSGGCVESPVCYLYLKLVGTDDWRPGFAQVRAAAGNHLSSNYFYIRRYLPRNAWHGLDMCDREVTPFGVKHERKVFVKRPVRTLEP